MYRVYLISTKKKTTNKDHRRISDKYTLEEESLFWMKRINIFKLLALIAKEEGNNHRKKIAINKKNSQSWFDVFPIPGSKMIDECDTIPIKSI